MARHNSTVTLSHWRTGDAGAVAVTSSLDERLRFAITHKYLIEVTYAGRARLVEPHDYGIINGTMKLLAFQLREHGRSGDARTRGWRLFELANIAACVVSVATFRGSRGDESQRHHVWDVLFARVGA
jgi:hypothetical protein